MPSTRPRIGVVGVPGAWSSEALADAVGERTGVRLLIDMSRCVVDLATGRVSHGDLDLSELDALMIKKVAPSYGPHLLDRLKLLRHVGQRGVPVFSDPGAVLGLIDRLGCTLTLARAGIPLPPTTITEGLPEAIAAVERYGEAVLKPLYSSKAEGMQLVRSRDGAELEARLRAFQGAGHPMLYVQKRLASGDRDLGVVFLGGEYVGTYARVRSASCWHTTTRGGGRYEPHEPGPELVALAWRAQALFQLDLATVDVLETPAGPVVLEVSAFGGFRGCQQALGVDLAARYARYALAQLGYGAEAR